MLRQYRERQFQAGLRAPEEDQKRLFDSPSHRNRHEAYPRPTANSQTRHHRKPLKHITNSFRTLFQKDRRQTETFQ